MAPARQFDREHIPSSPDRSRNTRVLLGPASSEPVDNFFDVRTFAGKIVHASRVARVPRTVSSAYLLSQKTPWRYRPSTVVPTSFVLYQDATIQQVHGRPNVPGVQCGDLILPEAFKAIRRQSRVTYGRVDRLVPKVMLDCRGVLAAVSYTHLTLPTIYSV